MANEGVSPQLLKDYQNYFSTTQPGESRDWAGGKLTRDQYGSYWTSPSGQSALLTPESDINALMQQNPSIANAWGAQYNYKAPKVQSPEEETPQESLLAPAPTSQPAITNAQSLLPTDAQNPSMQTRIADITSSSSPLMTAARTGAMQTANSRGLLNSAMAAGMGEKAAIEAAAPIAEADLTNKTALYNTAMQGVIQSGLSAQGANQNLLAQADQFKRQAELYRVQGDITKSLQAQQAADDLILQNNKQQAEKEWNTIDLEARTAVEYARLDQQNKDRFDATTSEIQASYQRDYLDIMTNPVFKTPEDRQAAINVLNEITKQRYTIAGSIAGVVLDWGAVTSPTYTPTPTSTEDNTSQGGTNWNSQT